nr:hypothetical protein [Myxococcus sp. CA033]
MPALPRKRAEPALAPVLEVHGGEARVSEVCEALLADVSAGRLSPDTLYIVDPARLESFRRLGDAVTCGTVEGFQVCVAQREGRFREALSRSAPSPTGTSVDTPR